MARRKRRRSLKLRWERAIWDNGGDLVIGADEVGVSAIAGPIVACAAAFGPWHKKIRGIMDSKTLKEKDRRYLARRIMEDAYGIGIGIANVDQINKLNLYHASKLALKLAVEALMESLPDHELVVVFIDHHSIDLPYPIVVMDKADEQVYSVAAASIVAKVFRDKLMTDLDRRFPEYDFASNKGYASPKHWSGLREHGSVWGLHRIACFKRLQGFEIKRAYRRRWKVKWSRSAVEKLLS